MRSTASARSPSLLTTMRSPWREMRGRLMRLTRVGEPCRPNMAGSSSSSALSHTGRVSRRARCLPRSVADPQRVLELTRQHWQIESALHYRRDMTFAEDRGHTCTGHAAQLNAVLNNIAIACLHHCPAPSLPAARRAVDYAVARMLTRSTTDDDAIILKEFSPYREFKGVEKLK